MTVSLSQLDGLRAFEAAARLGSLAGAGAELSLTADAVNRRIEALEADLGVPLLEKDGPGLTPQGRRLLDSLEPAFGTVCGAWRQARRKPGPGQLTLAVPPLFARTWLLPRLSGFGRFAPDVDLVIADRPHEAASGAVPDVAIEWGDFTGAEAAAERLTDEEVFPVCTPSSWPAEGGLGRATLLHHRCSPGCAGVPDWPAFLKATGRRVAAPDAGPRVAGTMIIDAARAGCGVALAHRTGAHDDLAAGRLVRPVPESMKTANGYWLLPGPASGRPEVQAFCAWLRQELAACFGPQPSARE